MHPLVHDDEGAPREPLTASHTFRARFLPYGEGITRWVYPDRVHSFSFNISCGPGPGVREHLRGHFLIRRPYSSTLLVLCKNFCGTIPKVRKYAS
jgi:hypothetical protein